MTIGDGRAAPSAVTRERVDAWYAEFRAPLHAYLRGLTRGTGSADDLFQETWIRLLTHPPRTLERSAVRAYVFTIATRLAIDAARSETGIRRWIRPARARRGSDEPEGDHLGDVADGAPPPDARHEIREDVARALGVLTPRDRALVWLAHVERYDHAEIAAILGLGANSVRVLLHRARGRAFEALRAAAPQRGGAR